MAYAIKGFRRKVARGYRRSSVVVSFDDNGMAVSRVKSNRRWLPVWHIIFFIYIAMLVRLVVMADMGAGSYNQRITELQNGNVIERVAATVMAMDPVSQALAGRIRTGMDSVQSVFEREVWNG